MDWGRERGRGGERDDNLVFGKWWEGGSFFNMMVGSIKVCGVV